MMLARSTTATLLAACLLIAFATSSSDAQPPAFTPDAMPACSSTLDTPVPAFVIEAAAATPRTSPLFSRAHASAPASSCGTPMAAR